MKSEITVYSIVIILAFLTPVTSYLAINNASDYHVQAMYESANKLEEFAAYVESGQRPVNVESIPDSFRYLASADRHLAKTFEHYQSASKSFLMASVAVVVLQTILLIGLLLQKRKIMKRSKPANVQN